MRVSVVIAALCAAASAAAADPTPAAPLGERDALEVWRAASATPGLGALVDALPADGPVSPADTSKLRAARAEAESALQTLAAGTTASACVVNDPADLDRVVALGRTGLGAALLRADQSRPAQSPVDALAQVADAGARLMRCQGPLEVQGAGARLVDDSARVAAWLFARGRLGKDDARRAATRLRAAVAPAGEPTPAALSRAVDVDTAWRLRVHAAIPAHTAFDADATAALLRTTAAATRNAIDSAARGDPAPFLALSAARAALLSPADVKATQSLDKAPVAPATLLTLLGKRPPKNVLGRYLVSRVDHATPVSRAWQALDEATARLALLDAAVALLDDPRAVLPRGVRFADGAVVTTVKPAASSAPPTTLSLQWSGRLPVLSSEAGGGASGACVVKEPGRYVAPDETLALLEERGAAAILDEVQVMPALSARGIDGVTISGLRSDSVWASCGFADGDTLLEVNGRRIDRSPDSILPLVLEETREHRRMTFNVRRRGGAPAAFSIEAP